MSELIPRPLRSGVLVAVALCLALAPWMAGAADLEDRLFDLQLIPLDSEPAPAFTLESLDGKKVSLSEYRGRAVLLYFFATW